MNREKTSAGARFLGKLALSMGVSALLVWLLLRQAVQGGEGVSAPEILAAAGQAPFFYVAAYFVCQVAQGLFRALRAGLLIDAGLRRAGAAGMQTPRLPAMFEVTLVRGACADMLPMRLGEFSYVAMLNQGWGLAGGDCLSSLSIGLLFDFAALLIVLGGAMALAGGTSLLAAAILLGGVCATGAVGIFWILPRLPGWCTRFLPEKLRAWRPCAAALRLLADMAQAVRAVAGSGVLVRTLLISALIRVIKYAGMLILFRGVCVAAWPEMADIAIPAALVALIAAEGAASLPVPSFLSFGTYEAGGALALTALGFGMAESIGILFAMHIVSQIIDYALGLSAFSLFTWKRNPDGGTMRAVVIVFLGASFATVGFAPLAAAAARHTPAEDAARVGSPVAVPADAVVPEGFSGRIVWSSNRYGSHNLLQLTLPGGNLEQLTQSGHAETYPRYSPDGTRIAFARSRPKWASHRNQSEWDIWVLDLATRTERRVAEHGFAPVWMPDGKTLLFVKDGTALATVPADGSAPETLLGISAGGGLQTPNIDASGTNLVLTIRRQGVWLRGTGETPAPRRIDDGCEITFRGGSPDTLIWMGHPGRQKNAIFTADAPDFTRRVLLDLPGEFSHEYFPKTSADGRWLVFAASAGGHEHDVEDYEIFLWEIGTPPETAARLTWHTANDNWPDLFPD